MEPKLALTYNSQAGNGLLGVGWSLSGLSAITRCPRTMAQDGVRGGVNFDANDRFCLDGQRLMVVSGTYGGDGAEYRTERESFSKIVSYGTAGNGPAWFKVWTKAGQIVEYGNTADSRIEAVRAPGAAATWPLGTVRIWAQNKVSDTKGNYYTVTYTEDPANGDYYPSRIDYTGNANTGLPASTTVQFHYEVRSDIATRFISGSLIKNPVRLKTLQAWTSGILAKEYRLSFATSPSTARSTITQLIGCDGDSNCQNPVNFSWLNTSRGWQDTANYLIPIHIAADGTGDLGTRFVDLNGDGLPDFVYSRYLSNKTLTRQTWLNTGNGWQDSPNYLIPTHIAADGMGDLGTRFVDLNGDGLPDFVYSRYYQGNLIRQTWLNTGNGWQEYPGYLIPTHIAADGISDLGTRFVDLNGDGLPDFVYSRYHQGNLIRQTWLNTGSGWQDAPSYLMPTHIAADGTGDLGTRFEDLNGDGLPDFVYSRYYQGSLIRQTWLNTGNGWQEYPGYLMPTHIAADGISDLGTRFVDLNGDGLPDFVYSRYYQGSLIRQTWLNTGSGWQDAPSYIMPTHIAADGMGDLGTRLEDVNGDGLPDFVYSRYANGALIRQTWYDITGRDIISSIGTNGAIVAVSGSYVTNKGLYEKSSGANKAAPPFQDLQTPLHVVSSISASNGLGGTLTTTYKYGGLKAEIGTGRGLLGFNWVEATQAETGLVTKTTYRQDWPYVGLPSQVTKRIAGGGNNGLLSQTDFTYGCTNPQTGSPCAVAAGNRYFPYASQSIEQSWDLNGAVLPTLTTTNAFDGYGNATQVTVSTGDGYGKTTTNTYQNDVANWILGRLQRSQVQSTTP